MTKLRLTADPAQPYTTDGGNRIIDCRFAGIDDPAALDARLSAVPASSRPGSSSASATP